MSISFFPSIGGGIDSAAIIKVMVWIALCGGFDSE